MSGMTDHPLTETDAAEMWDEHHVPASPILRWALASGVEREATTALLRAAFDKGREHERTNTEDPRPWEPLDGGKVYPGYEVRRDYGGMTITAVVASVDGGGDPWTAEGGFIGPLQFGTWYVRRPTQELPTKHGTVIIPADGHERIKAVSDEETYYAREAVLVGDHWRAVWQTATGAVSLLPMASEEITEGTWKEETE